MKRIITVSAAFLTFFGPAFGQQVEFSNALPFEVDQALLQEVVTDGVPYTVIIVSIQNGPTYTRSITIHCEAENESGMTWDVAGTVSSFSPGEARQARIVQETEDPWVNPTSAHCVVIGFEGATPI